MNIRSAFPSEDGSYTGYIVGDDDESTFDSKLEQAWKDFLNSCFNLLVKLLLINISLCVFLCHVLTCYSLLKCMLNWIN